MTNVLMDEDAEISVLAACMSSTEATLELTELLAGPEDFCRPAHQVIFWALFDLASSDEPTDPITLKGRLEKSKELSRVGGAPGLFKIHASFTTLGIARHHAGRVAELAERRRAIEATESLLQRLEAGNVPVSVALSDFSSTAQQALHPDSGKGLGRIRLTPASEIKPRPVVWAWAEEGKGRIPAGSLASAAGREGTGKSSFGIWMASQITRGELSGSLYGRPRGVVYVAVEDSWAHTLVPRLMAAGADLTKVYRAEVVISEDETTTLSLPHDLVELERLIEKFEVGLVVLDPLMSTIGASLDTHREREVRKALDPLSRLADRTGAVILGIAHFNKGSGNDASSLITGSGAFKNVPRAILGFARDPEDGTRVMTQTKNSLGMTDLPSLLYKIDTAKVDTDEGVAEVGRFVFDGTSDRTVAEILSDTSDADDRHDRDQAAEWLRDYVSTQGEASANDALKAGAAAGFSRDVLKRAKKKAGVISRKPAMGSGWIWAINTEESTKGAKSAAS